MQEDTEAFRAVLLSLEASILCLHLMTAPNMPQQVYNEEAIGLLVEVLKKHLQTNVLAFYDARMCHIHRPNLEDLGTLSSMSSCRALIQEVMSNDELSDDV